MLNRQTPRLFVAATRQDEGKTSVSLGLFHALKQRLGEIGYIKPVGQRTVDVQGFRIDEDSVLMEHTYGVRVPIEDMSPLAIGKQFTRRFLESEADAKPMVERLHRAFDRAAWEKDFVIIEGSGHAGVGSVFGLSNARVAHVLDSPAVIVTRGGIGDPVDDVNLSLALFEKHRVRVLGVIFNKVIPEKIDTVREYGGRALRRLGLDLLGAIPLDPLLQQPVVGQVARETGARFVAGEAEARRRVARLHVWTGPPDDGGMSLPGTLVVASGLSGSAALSALAESAGRPPGHAAGILCCDGILPSPAALEAMGRIPVPCLSTDANPFEAVALIQAMSVKTEAGDDDKIRRIQRLVAENVDIERLLALCRRPAPAA